MLPNIVQNIIRILENKKAQDIAAFNIANIINYTDYAIIVTALSINHIKVLFSEIEYYAHKNNIKILNSEKKNYTSGWTTIDLGNCIVHIFIKEKREFYQIEKLWENHNNEKENL